MTNPNGGLTYLSVAFVVTMPHQAALPLLGNTLPRIPLSQGSKEDQKRTSYDYDSRGSLKKKTTSLYAEETAKEMQEV